MAQVLVPTMARFIAKQVEDHGAENVSVYGDSAGGTLGMLAVQHLVITGQTVPSRMVVISPGLTPISDTDLLIDDPVYIVIGEGPVWGDRVSTKGITRLLPPHRAGPRRDRHQGRRSTCNHSPHVDLGEIRLDLRRP